LRPFVVNLLFVLLLKEKKLNFVFFLLFVLLLKEKKLMLANEYKIKMLANRYKPTEKKNGS
jgi:hypothetical protein